MSSLIVLLLLCLVKEIRQESYTVQVCCPGWFGPVAEKCPWECQTADDCDGFGVVCSDSHVCQCPQGYSFVQQASTCIHDAAPNFAAVRTSMDFYRPNETIPHHVPRLRFHCDIDRDKTYTGLEVHWLINDREFGALVHTDVLPTDLEITDLLETDLIDLGYGLGIRIKCGVKARLGPDSYTNATQSEDFFAGIKVYTPIVNKQTGISTMSVVSPKGGDDPLGAVYVIRGQDGDIVVQPTVPIGCPSLEGDKEDKASPCTVNLAMFDTDVRDQCTDSSISVKNAEYCGVQLRGYTAQEWSEGVTDWSANYSMTVTTSNDRKYGQRNTYTVQLKTEDQTEDENEAVTSGHPIWQAYRIPDITVFIQDDGLWERKVCYVHVDPHMGSSDGKRYNNQNDGEFVVYKHTSLPIEIQMKTKSCNYGRATCACSLSIRAGSDVFGFWLCGSLRLINYLSCSENLLDVRRLGNTVYGVYTPIGTYIHVTLHTSPGYKDTMNVDIFMAPKDFNSIEGLCGNFNGNLYDDFMDPQGNLLTDNNQFSKSWMVTGTERSLFEMSNWLNPAPWGHSYTLCVCQAPDGGTGSRPVVHCSSTDYKECTEDKKRAGRSLHCTVRGRRSTSVMADLELERRLSLMDTPEDGGHAISKRSSGTPLTRAEAIAVCESIFSAQPTYSIRNDVPDVNMEATVLECALDVEVAGDTEWANAHVDSWQSTVIQQMEVDEEFQSANEDISEAFKAIACPYNCNSQGNCTNGTCVCVEGFSGDFCAINRSALLELSDISGGGVCDRETGDNCDECVFVQGDGFLEDGFLTCRVAILLLSSDGTYTSDVTPKGPARVVNYYEAYCCISELSEEPIKNDNSSIALKYEVAVSNDGVHFGSSKALYVYTSQCQDYVTETTGEIVIHMKPGYCYIGGQCYNNGTENPIDSCYQCLTDEQLFLWTLVCTASDGRTDGGFNYLPLVVSAAVLALVAAIVVVVMVTAHCKKAKVRVDTYPAKTRYIREPTMAGTAVTTTPVKPFSIDVDRMPEAGPIPGKPLFAWETPTTGQPGVSPSDYFMARPAVATELHLQHPL